MLVVTVFFVVILLDQTIKIWVKTHMCLHQSIHITDWFYILFTENNGMAFGMELFDKIFLTTGRILLAGAVAYYISRCIRRGIKWGLLICLTLIMAGAVGNIVDCLFYGLIFNSPAPPQIASFVPFGQGYSTWFYGHVVDMFYFPLFEWVWPAWMPFCGGEHFIFFSPIFNFADACISSAVIILLLFYPKQFSSLLETNS
ncbi:MAG: lipoprotein signal peptidase [Bacteroidaceae bacterium]|nr:lipoprotein signal peptidase [Bacteroidaceae bacterium]